MKFSKTAVLCSAVGLSCLVPAHAEMWDRKLDYVASWTNWTNLDWMRRDSADLRYRGHGQWECYTGNGNDSVYTEYDTELRVIYDTRARIDPNPQHDCNGWSADAYREFRLRLRVWRWDGAWAALNNQEVVWQDRWGDWQRLEYNYPNPISGKQYLVRADTYVQGRAWLYGQIQFRYTAI